MRNEKSNNLLRVEKNFHLRQNSLSSEEKSDLGHLNIPYSSIKYIKKKRGLFSLFRKENQFKDINDSSFNNVPTSVLELDIKLIPNAKDINLEYKKTKSEKKTKFNIIKTSSIKPSNKRDYAKNIKIDIYNQYLTPDNNISNNIDINNKLVILRRHMLNTYYLEHLSKLKNKEIQTNQSKKLYVEIEDDLKVNQKFGEDMLYNVESMIKSVKLGQNSFIKKLVFKEIKPNQFFHDILNKIYRRVQYIKENNQLLSVDLVLNLIYDEVKKIKSNHKEEFKIKNTQDSNLKTVDDFKSSPIFKRKSHDDEMKEEIDKDKIYKKQVNNGLNLIKSKNISNLPKKFDDSISNQIYTQNINKNENSLENYLSKKIEEFIVNKEEISMKNIYKKQESLENELSRNVGSFKEINHEIQFKKSDENENFISNSSKNKV